MRIRRDKGRGFSLFFLEPLLLMLVGGRVGTIVISLFLPMFNLMQQMSKKWKRDYSDFN